MELGGSHHVYTISSSVSRPFLKDDPLQPHFLLLPRWGALPPASLAS